jgi:hypothetical protein
MSERIGERHASACRYMNAELGGLTPTARQVTSVITALTAQENGHRYDTGAARGRINLNKKGERGEERGGEDQMNAAGETPLLFQFVNAMATIVRGRNQPSRSKASTARFVKCFVRWSCGLLASRMICCRTLYCLLLSARFGGVSLARTRFVGITASRGWEKSRLFVVSCGLLMGRTICRCSCCDHMACPLQSFLSISTCVLHHHRLCQVQVAEQTESSECNPNSEPLMQFASQFRRRPSVNIHRILRRPLKSRSERSA